MDRVSERRERLDVVLLRLPKVAHTHLHVIDHSPLLPSIQSPGMILENGVIRTMDPSLPTARALAIAGTAHRRRGRHARAGAPESRRRRPRRPVRPSGLHRLARPLSDLVALPARRETRWRVRPHGRARSSPHAPPPRHVDTRHRLALCRVGRRSRLQRRWTRSPATRPRCSSRRTTTRVAQLRRSRPVGRGPGGRRRRRRARRLRASRPGSCARNPPGSSARASRCRARTSSSRRPAQGLRIAAGRGVVAIHDKDGWLGAPGIFQRVAERDGLSLRVWQSIPYERLPELEALGIHAGIGDDFLRIGYLKAFMDGTLGSQTAWMLDGSGVVITSGAELAEVIREGARRDGPSPCTRSATGRTARRSTHSSRRARSGGRSASVTGSSMRSASHRRTSAVSRSSESRAPSSSATRRRIAISPSASGPSESTARTRSARSGTQARWSRTAPTRRSRSSIHSPASAQAFCGRSTNGRRGGPSSASRSSRRSSRPCVNPAWLSGDERRRGKLLPGYLADLVVLSRDPLECPLDELESVEVVATMVGGRWVHNPPPWD